MVATLVVSFKGRFDFFGIKERNITNTTYVQLRQTPRGGVTFRQVSMFAPDIEVNRERVMGEIWGKMVCVIGGGGSGAEHHRNRLCLETMSVIFDGMTGRANGMRTDLKGLVMWVNMQKKQ